MKALLSILIATAAPSTLLRAARQELARNAQENTGAHAPVREQQPPFDKLELFGFFSAAPYDVYAAEIIQARGTNFTPDATFIAAFPIPAFQKILMGIKPKASTTMPANRGAAYELLRRGWRARQNRELKPTGTWLRH